MRLMMRFLSCLLLLNLLSGCLGGVKPKLEPSVYDFGLEPSTEAVAANGLVRIDEITATEYLHSNRIRYRLNYQNPAQVYTYTESRWTAQPSELLAAKSRAISSVTATQARCSLQLQLEAFDHVFDSLTDSFGVIRLSAILKDKKTRNTLAQTQIQERAAAPSADAQGGVFALSQASTAALEKSLNWGNTTAAAIESCH